MEKDFENSNPVKLSEPAGDPGMAGGEMSGEAPGSKSEPEVLDEEAGGEAFGEKIKDREELVAGGEVISGDSGIVEGEIGGDASGNKFEREVSDDGAGGEAFGEKMKDCEELDTGGEGIAVGLDSFDDTVGV